MTWPARLACLIFLLGLIGVVTYWALVLTAPGVAIAPVGGSQSTLRDVSAQSSAQLFGIANSAATAPTSTSLASVQVQGIISAGPKGAAVIAFDGKPGRFIAVGSTLAPEKPEAKLIQVKAGSVVLSVNGRNEEYQAPPRASLAVLSSGVGRSRNATDTAPAPGQVATPPQGVPPIPALPAAIPASPPPAPSPPAGAAAAAAQPEMAPAGASSISPRSGGGAPAMAKPGPNNP
jgi:type II secretory pathway component PulC